MIICKSVIDSVVLLVMYTAHKFPLRVKPMKFHSLIYILQVLHFSYEHYRGNISDKLNGPSLDFRSKDWGPAPRWVAFVDFFLASRAKSAVITGAHRRVGTTYAQLVAALAAANKPGMLLR